MLFKSSVKTLCLLFLLIICLSLQACSDTTNGQNNPNDTLDRTEDASQHLDLTRNGEVLFTIVYKERDSDIKKEVDKLVKAFKAKA